MTTRFIPLTVMMDRLLRNPTLKNVQYEAVIDYTADFIESVGLPETKMSGEIFQARVENYKAELPCELTDETFVYINGQPAYASADLTITSKGKIKHRKHGFICDRGCVPNKIYTSLPAVCQSHGIYTYKIQGRYIFTNIKDGEVVIQYDAMKTDENGEPMIPDNRLFMKALELYIKREYQALKVEEGKLHPSILDRTEQDYCWTVGQMLSREKTPNYAEMATIINALHTLRANKDAFDTAFASMNSKVAYKHL